MITKLLAVSASILTITFVALTFIQNLSGEEDVEWIDPLFWASFGSIVLLIGSLIVEVL